MNEESWREGPPRALPIVVFRQTCGGWEPVEVPTHITLETIVKWLRQDSHVWAGARYTVFSVATEDEYEIEHTHGEVMVTNVKSTVY